MTKSNTQPAASHRIRVLFALLLVLVVTGCTTIRFTYNNGDTLLYWWINAYVDLEGDQSDIVKKDIDKVFAWHRQTQLHDYAALLQKAKQQLNGNVTPQVLHGMMNEVKARGQKVALHAAPQLADLARSLQPEQIGNLEEKFAKNNRDYRRKFMSGDTEQRKKIRYKKTMEQLKIWFGKFSDEQEDAIRRLSDARPLDNEVWLQERMRRQRTIVDLVKRVQSQRLDKPATVALIENTIRETFNRLDTPERKANYDAQLKFYADIIRLTTPEQKAHAQQRMQGWIEDMNTLAREKQA